MKTKLSIVIPVYNGAKSIGALVDQLVSQLGPIYELDIVLVNDASPDESEAVCRALYERYPQTVHFYSLAKNVGEHNAVMAGLNFCRGDYAAIMDDDFQNPVSEVSKLVSKAIEGECDVVYSYYADKKHSWFRNWGSHFNNAVATRMLKKPKDLYLSSFKVINRFLIDEIIKYDLPFPYIDGLILRTTDRIGRQQVLHEPRREGASGYTFRKLVSLWLNMFTNFSILPLRVAMVLGFVFAFFGFALGIQSVVEKILRPDLPVGWSALIVSVSIFSGVQLMAIGMVGEYVGRIFLSQNKKPQFTVKKAYAKRSVSDGTRRIREDVPS